MKQISVEDIRFMRLRYKHDVTLVRVLDEVLEYREAEEQADTRNNEAQSRDAIAATLAAPRSELARECGGK